MSFQSATRKNYTCQNCTLKCTEVKEDQKINECKKVQSQKGLSFKIPNKNKVIPLAHDNKNGNTENCSYKDKYDCDCTETETRFDNHNDFRKYLNMYPKDVDTLFEYADWCWKQKQYKTAEIYCQKVLKLNPQHADAHNRLGTVYRGQNQLNEAIKEYKLAIKCDPKHKIAYSNLGNALSLGETTMKEAEESYLKAIEIDPDYSGAHVNYGVLLRRSNRREEATKHYEIAMKLKTDDSWIYFNMANLMDELDKFEKAAEYFEKCLELNPTYSAGYHNYAVLLHKKNRHKDACKQYQLSLLYEFESSLTHRNYALALANLNDIEGSLYHCRYALQYEKEDTRKKELNDLMKWIIKNEKFPQRHVYFEENKKLIL